MKIAFFGSSLVSSYWNGAATYYRGLLKALADLGHRVTFYEPDAFERQQHRDMIDPPWARVVVYPATEDGWRRSLEEASADCDLLVKASGVGVFDEVLEKAVPDVVRPGTTAVFWDVDAPATLESVAENTSHHLRYVISRYELVLTYGGGDQVVQAYEAIGANGCVPVYNAVDPETHYPVAPDPNFCCDLSFLGNRLPDREQRVEEFFLSVAEAKPSCRFLLGGAGWNSKPKASNVRYAGHVGTAKHNAFYSSPLATLNINRSSMVRFGFSPPTRIFEAAGAGACLITDAWQGLQKFLEPEREILLAQNGEDVAELLGRLTRRRSRKIGLAARKHVLSAHTYKHRAQQVCRILDAESRTTEAAA